MAADVTTRVDGRTLTLSNLDKVLYPATGYTKAEVIAYYSQIAPVLLPHITDRALTRVRFPDAGRRSTPARSGLTTWWPTMPRPWSGWPTWPPWSCTCPSGPWVARPHGTVC